MSCLHQTVNVKHISKKRKLKYKKTLRNEQSMNGSAIGPMHTLQILA